MNSDINEKTEGSIKMGRISEEWQIGKAKYITFSVTQECNLRCSYCYMTHKNNYHRMTLEKAKQIVDYILNNREIFNTEAIVWEFIGGEPLLEIDLIDKISEYIKKRMYILNHPWLNNYMFFICTNGLLYSTKPVQRYIKRNRSHVNIGITVDGNKQKHDLSRKKVDGTGSYDDVMNNVQLWLEQFPNSMTKATFSHADLPFLKDSIVSLWDNGIYTVAANVVFEDVWQEGDPEIFESELMTLADYIIDNKLWNDFTVRFFEYHIGFPLSKHELEHPFCGSGKMLAIDNEGNFYPCIRFVNFCQNSKYVRTIGNVEKGLDFNRMRAFEGLSIENQSKDKCISCQVASGCANCTGNDYDNSGNGTIFFRSTFICEMHNSRVRANKYFWERLAGKINTLSPRELHIKNLCNNRDWLHNHAKFMYFVTSDIITPHCDYIPRGNKIMSSDTIKDGLSDCYKYDFIPVFLGEGKDYMDEYLKTHFGYVFTSNRDSTYMNKIDIYTMNDLVFDSTHGTLHNVCVLNVCIQECSKLCDKVKELLRFYQKVNINLFNKYSLENKQIDLYVEQLDKIADYIISEYTMKKRLLEVNVLTDELFNRELSACGANSKNIALAPNGKYYACPAFYFQEDNSEYEIDIQKFIIRENVAEKLPLCNMCELKHCNVCKYDSKMKTDEYNIPTTKLCNISKIEYSISNRIKKFINNGKDDVC